MSDLLIQAALEKRLATLSPAMATAYENVAFTPVTGTPYQRVNFMPNTPGDDTMGRRLTQFRGLFQITLCYPVGAGRGPAQARAKAIRDLFKPPITLTEGGINVNIHDTTRIAAGMVDDDRWCVPVTVPWHAYIAS